MHLLFAPHATVLLICMMQPEIVFEDYYVAVIHKPAGLMVEADAFENPSVEEFFFRHLQEKFPTHKEYFIGFPHRLDRVTQGLLLIAKTKGALTSLNQQLEQKKISKTYFALTEKASPHKSGKLKHFLKKDNRLRKAVISKREQEGFKACEIAYEYKGETSKGLHLLKVELLTGRYHQIRAQLAYEQMPVAGDATYGASTPYKKDSVALIAQQIVFIHPKNEQEMLFEIALPEGAMWKVQ